MKCDLPPPKRKRTIAAVGEIGLHTIGDLGDRHVIYAHCGPCRRSVPLETSRLIAMFGARVTIPELRNRLTCRRCGIRSNDIRIVFSLPSR